MLEIGSLIHSSFEIEELIGIGGMGKTYLAKDIKLGNKLVHSHVNRLT